MLVYTALRYLCRNAPWQGTIRDLAKYSRCGGRMTTLRMLENLQSKGLVQHTKQGYILSQNGTENAQNGTENAQNGTENAQNGTNPKRKSNQKENIKENKEVSECDNSAHTHTQEDLKDNNSVHSEQKRSVGTTRPTWQEWYAYGKEQGINYLTCLKSFAYYESVGWAKISNWRATLIYWDLKDKTR